MKKSTIELDQYIEDSKNLFKNPGDVTEESSSSTVTDSEVIKEEISESTESIPIFNNPRRNTKERLVIGPGIY